MFFPSLKSPCKSYLTGYIYNLPGKLDHHILKPLALLPALPSSGCLLWPCCDHALPLVTPGLPGLTSQSHIGEHRRHSGIRWPGHMIMMVSLTTIASWSLISSPWFIQVLSASSTGGSRGTRVRPQASWMAGPDSILCSQHAAHATFSLSTGSSSQQHSRKYFQHSQNQKRHQAWGTYIRMP